MPRYLQNSRKLFMERLSKEFMDPYKNRSFLYKAWYFIWKDNSLLSWLINILLAFILVKFLIYPGLGLVLDTTHPVVAVVSGSMEHDIPFEQWWEMYGGWYEEKGITQEEFLRFDFKNGFNQGDIMVLRGNKPELINIGDTIVFRGNSNNPIIHRVVHKWKDAEGYHFQTKGDHNSDSSSGLGETDIFETDVIGKATFRIPYLGWFKIGFSQLL